MNSGKRLKKDNLYDDRLPEIRWRFPHQRARWFGMTVLFGARTYLCKFQFVYLLSKADKHILYNPSIRHIRQVRRFTKWQQKITGASVSSGAPAAYAFLITPQAILAPAFPLGWV